MRRSPTPPVSEGAAEARGHNQEPSKEASQCTPWLFITIKGLNDPLRTCVMRLEGELLIGRDPQAALVLRGDLVSRRHAKVRARGSVLEVQDTSSHGTLVDGVPLCAASLQVANECDLVIGCNRIHIKLLQICVHNKH